MVEPGLMGDMDFKNRLFGGGGTASGVLGGIGSIHNVCHSLCVSVVSALAIFGITTQILPLMFLMTYQLYFWLAALVFTALSFYFFLKQKQVIVRDRNLLFINGGLLLFGLPFSQLADYMDLFRFMGGSLAVLGVFLLFKLTLQSLLFIIVIGGFLVNQFLMYRMRVFDQTAPAVRTMGVLGSQHIHADFKVYVNGQALDFAKPEYYMKSSFMHVDDNQNKEDAGGVLHMHATNVPLWLFFKSIGMNVSKGSKFYLNGKKVDNLDNYVFQDLDKILISDGPENDPVTNFAKNHQK